MTCEGAGRGRYELVLLARRAAGLRLGLAVAVREGEDDEFVVEFVVDDAVENEEEEEVFEAFDCDRGFCCFLGLSLR